MGPMQQSSLGLILQLHHVSEPYGYAFLLKIKKNHHNSKSTYHTKFSHSGLRSAYPKIHMCRFSSLFKHFCPFKLTFLFSFFVRGRSANSQKIHILLILTGKNASKWLELHVFRVQGMPNPMPQVLSLCNKQFLKNQNFRQKFNILLILTGKNAFKWLEWCIVRVQGVPNAMALVLSLYDKQFLTNHNFRRQVA